MVLRKATLEDLEKLVRIRLEYLKTDFEVSEEQEEKLKKQLPGYYVKHLGEDFEAYIAEVDGVVVSSVFLVIHEKPANPSFLTGKVGEVLNVYTKPEYRRQGLASRLLLMMMEESKTYELSYLELIATDSGYPLYRKLGFQDKHFHFAPMKLDL